MMKFLCRAKIKVRYSLLIALSCVAVYTLANLGEYQESLFSQHIDNGKVDGELTGVLKRSFSPILHDGRELLNEVPRTRKTQTVFADSNWQAEEDQKNEEGENPIVKIFTSNYPKKGARKSFAGNDGSTVPGAAIRRGRDSVVSFSEDIGKYEVTNSWSDQRKGDKYVTALNAARKQPPRYTFDELHTKNINGMRKETLARLRDQFYKPTKKQIQNGIFNSVEPNPVDGSVTIVPGPPDTAERNQNSQTEEVAQISDVKHFFDEMGAEKNQPTYALNSENEDDENDSEEYEYNDNEEKEDNTTKQANNQTIFNAWDSNITYYTKDYSKTSNEQVGKLSIYKTGRGIFPMSPQKAISLFGDRMPWWEKYEVMNYPNVWFLGLEANKSIFHPEPRNNFGFDKEPVDDKEGYYRVVAGDHIGYRYEIVEYLGSGTFGLVIIARDWSYPPGRLVALKVMHIDEDDKYANREIEMMNFIEKNAKNHDYFSRMLATFEFRNHKCLVLQLLGSTMGRRLHDVVRNMTLFRQYAEDIFRGMYYLHQMKIIHGDLKPENIMYAYGKNNMSSGQLLKIADFGIGCVQDSKQYDCPAYYIQTRYYRAPEVILGIPFSTQADMWSVGVILAEFFLGVPPFFGESETDQLAAMMEVLGLPPVGMVAQSPRKKIYMAAMCYKTENGFQRKPYRKPLQKVLNEMDPALYDLIARLLEYDPNVRITAEQALRHPFVTGVYPAIGLQPSMLMKRMRLLRT